MSSENEAIYRAYLQKVAACLAAGESVAARQIAEDAVAQFPKTVRLRDALASLADFNGEPDTALATCVRSANILLKRMSKEDLPTLGADSGLTAETRIFISGYLYSGSGAVHDYLCDYEGFGSWTPVGEMRLIKFPGGMGALAKGCVAQGGLDAQALVDFYLHIRGRKMLVSDKGTYDEWRIVNRHSRKLWREPGARGYLQACLECFVDLHRAWLDRKDSPEAVRGLFRSCVRDALNAAAAAGNVQRLLVDQAINAFRLDLAELVPPSSFIVVHRDPRDQFVDAAAASIEKRREIPDIHDFAESYRATRSWAADVMAEMSARCGHRFLHMSFERFVVDFKRSRRMVDEFVGIDGNTPRRKRFSIARSRPNVGKFRNRLSDADAAILAEGNGQFTYDGTNLPAD